MTNKLQALRGMKDLFGEDFRFYDYIIETVKPIMKSYCYEGASTPLLEYSKVFDRTLGNDSDVMSKEIYNFLDRNGDNIALRPEFTAGIMRGFISNGLKQKLPLKLYSYGPVFRYDRPQAGRQRQFHQINCEHIGSDEPYSDAEIISFANHLLRELKILNQTNLEINSLGCQSSRMSYQTALVDYFSKYKDDLSNDSKRRLSNNNVLRILDSKNENDKKIVKEAPLIANYYSTESKKYFDEVLRYLDMLNVNYKINPRLARGLDYYCHTAFEFTTDKLGAQNTVIGGGRYDYLCQLMGGAPTPAIGFALGVERAVLMMKIAGNKPWEHPPLFHLIPIGEECRDYAITLLNKFRHKHMSVRAQFNGSVQKRMEKALKNNAKYIIFVGPEEMHNNNFKIRFVEKKEEHVFSLENWLEFFFEKNRKALF